MITSLLFSASPSTPLERPRWITVIHRKALSRPVLPPDGSDGAGVLASCDVATGTPRHGCAADRTGVVR
jgi:hypothetical protein